MTEMQAMEYIRKLADENQWAVRKDIDALLETGEVDSETVWSGYLADIVAELGDIYEENADLFDSAIVDFYCEQMEGMYEEEDDTVADLLSGEWQDYTDGDIPLTDALMEDLQDTYTRLVADGCEDAIAEAVHIVADAN